MGEFVLSIVVPSYNSEAYIERCLQSLQREMIEGVEVLLVDGKSQDSTMEIVDRYRHLFSEIISEPDSGQSEAFNKGFKRAQGQYLTWVNSDDELCPGALRTVVEYLRHASSEWYTANMVYIDSDSCIQKCLRSGGFEKNSLEFGILHVFGPSTIFSKKLFMKAGPFREDFHFCMDSEYWWRLARMGNTYERIPIYLWALRVHAAAKTSSAIKVDTPDLRPEIKYEREKIKEWYYCNVSRKRHRFGRWYVKLSRILRLHYVFSILHTKRWRGCKLDRWNSPK